MPHADRPMMNPAPTHTFDQAYNALRQLANEHVELVTTGKKGRPGVPFKPQARPTRDGVRAIVIPSKAYIYSCCWGHQTNHSGTWIGHYSEPIDVWVAGL